MMKYLSSEKTLGRSKLKLSKKVKKPDIDDLNDLLLETEYLESYATNKIKTPAEIKKTKERLLEREELRKPESVSVVYLLQEVPGTKIGRPKYNIIGAQNFGKIKVLLKEDTQIVRSPGPITYQLRRLLKDYTDKDYLLLSGDPKVIGLAIAVACDINNGKYTTLTWDRQEKMYYATEFNIHERGEINEQDRL